MAHNPLSIFEPKKPNAENLFWSKIIHVINILNKLIFCHDLPYVIDVIKKYRTFHVVLPSMKECPLNTTQFVHCRQIPY